MTVSQRCFAAVLAAALAMCLTACTASPSAPPTSAAPTPSPSPEVTDAGEETAGTPETQAPVIQEPDILQDFDLTLSALDITRAMGAGWNLGNTLDAGGSDAMPITPGAQETAWGNPVTTKAMIDLLPEAGFRTLRIPVTWQRHIGPAPEYAIEELFMDRVQEVVDYGMENGLFVIVNLHHEDWHFPSSDNEEAAAILTAVWRQIAERFAGYSEKLLFEAMNEPRMKGTAQEWTGGTAEARSVINSWNYTIVRTIRATGYHNATRFLMIPTIAASADKAALDDFYMPKDERVIASVHAYTPYALALNTGSDVDSFDAANAEDTADIDALFARLDERFISRGIAVVMGETGCLNKGDNTSARAAWADYYTARASELGIPCLWWDNGIRLSSSGEAFGLMDRANLSWWYPEIVESMVKHYER